MIWSCPVCQGGLTLLDKTMTCAAGHSFDRAKQGYFNLLLANQKGSSNPGDDADMLNSRRGFLTAGHYSPLAEALVKTIQPLLAASSDERFQLLDTGCGEGYYLAHLQQFLSASADQTLCCAGSDISKEAAKLAARSHKDAEWSVASSFHLPVPSRSVDLLMRIFSPGDLDEVSRVLKPDGYFLRVIPGAEHLIELKDALYDEANLHDTQPTPEGFAVVSANEVRFEVALNDHASVQQLLTMTPFLWRGKREAREALQQANELKVGAHFVIQLYQLEQAPELAAHTPAPSLESLLEKRQLQQEKYAAKMQKKADADAKKQEKARLAQAAKEKADAFNWGVSSKVSTAVDKAADEQPAVVKEAALEKTSEGKEKAERVTEAQKESKADAVSIGCKTDAVSTVSKPDALSSGSKADAVKQALTAEAKAAKKTSSFSFAPRKETAEKNEAQREENLEKPLEAQREEEAIVEQVGEDVSSFLNEFVGRQAPTSAEPESASDAAGESHEQAADKQAAKEKFNNKGFSF